MSDLTPTARRTRTAIMTSAITLLSTRPEAPMTDIADAAGVSRSTLHRYFGDRPALLEAVNDLITSEWQGAVRAARLDEGTGLAAFRRLCTELLERVNVLAWWMISEERAIDADAESGADSMGSGDSQVLGDSEEEFHAIAGAIERGREDGSIDAAMTPGWLSGFIWAVLYSVRFLPADGTLTSFEAREQGMRTLMKTAAADPGSV